MNTAYNMDCMEAMRQMPDKCFDLAVVDPPYGLGIDGQKERYDKREPKHSRKAHARKDWDSYPPPAEYFRELARVSKNQIIWGGNYFVEALTAGHKGWIVWDKGQRGLTMSDCEIAYTSFDRPTRIVTINRVELLKEGTIHPTQKPVALYRWIFQHYARPGDKILDTHLGSGSSRIAAHEAGLDFMGFEIDPDYFAGALERYAAAEAQMSMFVQAAEREPPFEEIARTWAVTRGGAAFGRGCAAGAKRLIGGGRVRPFPMNLFTPIHYLICACACIFSGLVRAGFRRKGEIMEKTEWYIREYKCANGVCVKTKFPATRDDGIRIGSRRYQRELRRAEKNATEAKHEAARSLNNNFLAGVDKYLGMDYDDKAMARLCRRIGIPDEDIPAFLHAALEEKDEAARMALYLSADKEFENFIDRARRACTAAGVEFRYFWVTSDLDGHSLQPVRVHHHMVVNKEAAEICAAKWNAGETWDKKLYGAHHGDLTELAEYMISQVRSIPGKKRYHPSRTLKKPQPTKPIKARNPAAELRVPKGCEFIWRSENYAGRPQQLRYYRPPGSGTRGGEDDEDEGD